MTSPLACLTILTRLCQDGPTSSTEAPADGAPRRMLTDTEDSLSVVLDPPGLIPSPEEDRNSLASNVSASREPSSSSAGRTQSLKSALRRVNTSEPEHESTTATAITKQSDKPKSVRFHKNVKMEIPPQASTGVPSHGIAPRDDPGYESHYGQASSSSLHKKPKKEGSRLFKDQARDSEEEEGAGLRASASMEQSGGREATETDTDFSEVASRDAGTGGGADEVEELFPLEMS